MKPSQPAFDPLDFPRLSHPRMHSKQHAAPQEHSSYSDDEPLQTTLPTQSSLGPQNVTIWTHTETSAIAVAESSPKFPVLVGVRAPLQDHDGHERTPIDLVAILDVSGSMTGLKLNLVKQAVKFVIRNLGAADRLSIVTFSTFGRRVFPLRRMSAEGRESAMQAVDSRSLHRGLDQYCIRTRDRSSNPSRTKGKEPCCYFQCIMHAISNASAGGTFSYIESVGMIQDSFALCIGGLLSVVSQDVLLTVRSASSGVKIVAIPSGRHVSKITNEGQLGVVDVGTTYAEEEKLFLVYLSVPPSSASDTKTSLLDVSCEYRDVASNVFQIPGERMEILRPAVCSPAEKVVSLEVDQQRNRVLVAEAIAEAKGLAEMGNLQGARELLAQRRETMLTTPAAQAGDDLSNLLETEMSEIRDRMATTELYANSGRAFALAGMSSHLGQRAILGRKYSRISSKRESSNRGAGASEFLNYKTPAMLRMLEI